MEEKDIQRGQILLYAGPESFLLKEHISQMKKASFQKYGEFNVMSILFDPPDRGANEYLNQKTKEISAEIITPAFFGEKRVIFLENFPPPVKGNISKDDIAKYYQRIIKSLENLPAENVVIISAENPDRRTKIWKDLQKIVNQTQEFKSLESHELNKWILSRVASQGGKMLPSASTFLAEYCGNDLWWISQEINKLINYCEDKPISEVDIQKISVMNSEIADFALINSLQENNLKKALKVFQSELEETGAPQVVYYKDIVPAVRQLLKIIWAVKNNRTAKDVGVHPFVFSKWQRVASKFDFEKIKKAYGALVLIDEGLKNGKIEVATNDLRMFNLVIEVYFLEFFSEQELDLKKPLLKK